MIAALDSSLIDTKEVTDAVHNWGHQTICSNRTRCWQSGRIAKTIHILHYIDDAAFRRRILTQLNHTELRHRLGRRIHRVERGEIRSPLQQGQEEQLGSLGLALNAVVHWNAIYMQEAIRHVRQAPAAERIAAFRWDSRGRETTTPSPWPGNMPGASRL